MHEAATSQLLADAVLREANERNATHVLRVEVEVGKLAFLEPDQISFWAEVYFQGTIAQEAELEIKLIDPIVSCQQCGYAGGIPATEHPTYHLVLPTFQCPRCGSSKIVVKRGRECLLRRVELELPV